MRVKAARRRRHFQGGGKIKLSKEGRGVITDLEENFSPSPPPLSPGFVYRNPGPISPLLLWWHTHTHTEKERDLFADYWPRKLGSFSALFTYSVTLKEGDERRKGGSNKTQAKCLLTKGKEGGRAFLALLYPIWRFPRLLFTSAATPSLCASFTVNVCLPRVARAPTEHNSPGATSCLFWRSNCLLRACAGASSLRLVLSSYYSKQHGATSFPSSSSVRSRGSASDAFVGRASPPISQQGLLLPTKGGGRRRRRRRSDRGWRRGGGQRPCPPPPFSLRSRSEAYTPPPPPRQRERERERERERN